jgi:Glutathione synthase/Ribosomal protein S6 modification enzyme (glutaminyl transferase)
MNAKYYPLIKLGRWASLMKRRFTLPVKLFTSGFLRSESYYPELPQKSRFRMVMDQLGHIWKYGTIERYYFSYGLDIKGLRDKNDYLDDGWFLWKCAMLNTVLTDHDYTCILRDKGLFATLLTEWGFDTPHTVACVRTPEEAKAVTDMLFERGGHFFCKPLDGQCGGGVFRLDTAVDTDRDSVREKLSQGVYLVQTCVVQHPEMARIYDKSVNTLRILTVMDKETGKPVPVAGEVRFGAHGSVVDNLAAGGVAVGIDLQTGQLSEFGICKKGGARRTPVHPDSQVRFADVKLPYVREAVAKAEALHAKLHSIRLIGWDIAITPDGPVFIEGNDNPEISGLQTVNGGLKGVLKKILKQEF